MRLVDRVAHATLHPDVDLELPDVHLGLHFGHFVQLRSPSWIEMETATVAAACIRPHHTILHRRGAVGQYWKNAHIEFS